jgi:hypothetical protein
MTPFIFLEKSTGKSYTIPNTLQTYRITAVFSRGEFSPVYRDFSLFFITAE